MFKELIRMTDALARNDRSAILQIIAEEDAKQAKRRKQRLDKEYRNSLMIENTRFTLLQVEETNVSDFVARLVVRNITTRAKAVVYMRADKTFGSINYK